MRLPSVVLLITLAACSKQRLPGLELELTAKGFQPGCYEITGTDRENASNTTTTQVTVTASRAYNVGMSAPLGWSGSWSLVIVAREASCTGAVVARIEDDVELSLERPVPVKPYELSATDFDGDGFVSMSSGGTDCDDGQAMRRPGLAEPCDDGLDNDCQNGADCADGRDDDNDDAGIDCADSDCDSVTCDAGLCTVGATCSAGACVGTPKGCAAPTACRDAGVCDPVDGTCSAPVSPPGSTCSDLDPCTSGETCDVGGSCVGGTPLVCTTPNACQTGACDAGACVFSAVPNGSACSDDAGCSFGDACMGGVCTATPYVCAPAPACRAPGVCLGDGGCSFVADNAQNGLACGDAGVCVTGTCLDFPYAVSNVRTSLFPPANGRVLINCPVVFNTTDGGVSGNWCGNLPPAVTFTAQIAGSAAPAVVLSARNFEITSDGGSLRLVGNRPAIILVYGTAPTIIDGRLDVHAERSVPGAGGNHAQCGAQRGDNGLRANVGSGSEVGTGGGGAGFATRGGNGGATSWLQMLRGGDGGSPGPVTPVPLYGGCSGGVGGITTLGGMGSAGVGCTGGAGGGAIQISAAGPIRVGGTAVITCSGGGGSAPPARGGHGGCGGGSGGVLLLEGAMLDLRPGAWLTSNGGGGSEGSDYQNTGADFGQDGFLASANPAQGGEGLAAFGGDGGNGGAGALPPVSAPAFYTGGGGGGSVGRIYLRSTGQCLRDAGFSPAHTDFGGCN